MTASRSTGAPACFGVLVVEHAHVPEAEHGVTHAERREVHHRIADVAELEVEDGGHATVLLVELSGVPDHRRLASLRVDRVASQPPEAELEERIRPRLGAAVAVHVDVEADETRTPRAWRPATMPARS